VYETPDSLDDLAGPWDALVEQAGASVFQTSAWARAWWEAFGDGKHWHVLGVWAGDRLVGLAPFCWERTRSGARRLRTLGSPEADYGGVIVAPDVVEPVTAVLAGAVYEDPSWDVLWMPEVPQEAAASHRLLTHFRDRGMHIRGRESCTYRVPLPASWSEYLSVLSRPTRRRLLQKARRLEELGARVVRCESPSDPVAGVEAFVRLHTEQWTQKGRGSLLLNSRQMRFHTLLTGALAKQNRLDLCWLQVGTSVHAAVYDFRFGECVYSYLSAVDLRKLQRLSPGILLTLWRIRAAIQDGYSWYDLLRGDEPYKASLGARPYPNYTYQVVHPRRWRGWWYLVLGPLRERILRKEAAARSPHQVPHPGAPDLRE
jgi:CelD/BcsL family acetyltransferase involved in cellulose biosynthesis